MTEPKKQSWAYINLSLTGLILITLIFVYFDLDRHISGIFFNAENGWYLTKTQPWFFLYEYGTIPGIIFTLFCLFALLFSIFYSGLASLRKPFLIVVLTSVIGCGLLVNVVLKPYWGRPRPSQITEFGGEWEYRQPLIPGTPGKGQSFPCGHCSMGFLFITLIFFRKKYPGLAYSGAAFGIVFGFLMGTARVVQGAHFSTDVIWSAGVILLTALFLNKFLPDKNQQKHIRLSRRKKIFYGIITSVIALVIFTAFMTRRPVWEFHRRYLGIWPAINSLHVEANIDFTNKKISFREGGKPRILINTKGFGAPNIHYELKDFSIYEGNILRYIYDIKTSGYFSELHYDIEVILPKTLEGRFKVEFKKWDIMPKKEKL